MQKANSLGRLTARSVEGGLGIDRERFRGLNVRQQVYGMDLSKVINDVLISNNSFSAAAKDSYQSQHHFHPVYPGYHGYPVPVAQSCRTKDSNQSQQHFHPVYPGYHGYPVLLLNLVAPKTATKTNITSNHSHPVPVAQIANPVAQSCRSILSLNPVAIPVANPVAQSCPSGDCSSSHFALLLKSQIRYNFASEVIWIFQTTQLKSKNPILLSKHYLTH